jgi:two-component system, OmpR family, KDP operon response regulator KdpE
VTARVALVIDDESQIRRVLAHALADDFRQVLEAADGATALDLVRLNQPSLIVLDLGLPDTPGDVLCREIRKLSTVPILVLSARHADHEKALLLDAGADDYVTKPFSTLELKARVRALLRRASVPEETGPRIRNRELTMDLDARTLTKRDIAVHLTPIEWELVHVLMSHSGKTMTHRQLFSAVWPGRQYGDAQQYLRVHIANVRRKIEANPLEPYYIITEPGVGYRFSAAE